MTNSEVTELITALNEGTMSLDQVAERFRERNWPRANPRPGTSYLEIAERELDDPGPYVPGSFDDVSAAFHRSDITREQYRILAEAAAESMRAEDEGRGA